MASNHTLNTHPANFVIRGDLDVLSAFSSGDQGTGIVFIRNGGLYVEGLTDLDQTTINTTVGEFAVYGTNRVSFDMTSAIELTATAASFFKTTAAGLTLWASDTGAPGKVTVRSDGTGADSILVNATNATSGQVTVQSAGGSSSLRSVRILATDTTNGNVLIQGAGDMATGNPAVLIDATNATSGQVRLTSAGASTTIDAVQILATDTADGNILIRGSGTYDNSNPAVKIHADNAASGQIELRSLGDSATVDAVSIVAPGTVGGNVVIQAAGSTAPAINISSTNAASKIVVNSAGSGIDTVDIEAPAGGISLVALKELNLQSGDVAVGVKIATATSGVPVVIGTGTSLTTVAGDLLVNGTTTSLSTETLVVKDNIIIINSGNGELGLDSGVVARRFQTPNGAAVGDVIIPAPSYQETHEFVAGSAAPGTLNFDLYCSSVNDFYKGWWVYITSGPAVGVVRRIKSYDGTTKVATVYLTADNTPEPNYFNDGLDLVLVPVAGDDFVLMSSPYVGNFYSESNDEWTFATLAQTPDTIGVAGVSTANVQQYQNIKSGSISVKGKTYKNCEVTLDTATFITINKVAHGLAVGEKIRITDSFGITPALAPGMYSIAATGFTVDKFDISFPTLTAVTTSATVTIYTLEDSVVYTNFILPSDPEIAGITIPGVSAVEDIVIGKTSTALFDILNTLTYGSYMILVSDLNNTNGASATFMASSSGSGGSISRLTNSRGADGQRIGGTWTTGNKVQISHQPAGSGAGTYTYRVRISSAL